MRTVMAQAPRRNQCGLMCGIAQPSCRCHNPDASLHLDDVTEILHQSAEGVLRVVDAQVAVLMVG